jgi:nitroimidazol reductase NimA-like FMN-containing flavoprotein (pyridoxamine 5'-phosphate oxidase superfamily)
MTEQLTHDLQEPPVAGDEPVEIERLTETECWRLLTETPVGRVGVVVDGAAEIYPVNYIVDRTSSGTPTILFRTDPGTKLAGLGHTPHISFEVDDLDATDQTGWSVVVKGRAQQIRQMVDADERHRVEQIPVRHWYAGPKRHTIRLVPAEVTGRRISRRHDPALHGLPSIEEWTGRDIWIPALTGRLRARVR